ncbi:MAG: ABC transporter permease [Eubacteriales bacterium]|nr:ABC transporter permease [Eubacteriales bacterium]
MDITSLITSLPPSVSQGLIWGIMAIGVYITFKILDVADLSVDGTLSLGGAMAVVMILKGVPPAVALVWSFGAGLIAGLATGVLYTVLGIPVLLAGILTQISLYSINLNIMGMSNLAVSIDNYNLVVSLRNVTAAILVTAIILAVLIALMYWFFGTELGMTLRATGSNPNMSRAQGINTKTATVIALALSNGLVGLAGGLIAQYQGNADVNMGRGAIVIGLAAVIIGEVIGEAIFGKRMNFALRLVFAVIGAVIYYLVITFVLWLGFPSQDMKLFSAIVVAVFLAVPYLKQQRATSFSRAGQAAKKYSAEAAGDKEGSENA